MNINTINNPAGASFRTMIGIGVIMTALLLTPPAWAENEVIYNPATGQVVMPLVVIGDDAGRIPAGDILRYRTVLQQDADGSFRFTLIEAEVKAGLLDREVEKYISIGRGVYGQTIATQGGTEDYAQFGIRVTNDPANPGLPLDVNGGRNGFQQVELPPGTHEICFNEICRIVTVAENGPGRLHRCDVFADEDIGTAEFTCTTQP